MTAPVKFKVKDCAGTSSSAYTQTLTLTLANEADAGPDYTAPDGSIVCTIKVIMRWPGHHTVT